MILQNISELKVYLKSKYEIRKFIDDRALPELFIERVKTIDSASITYSRYTCIVHASSGLNISIVGSTSSASSVVSSSQSIEEGAQVPPGTIVSVNFIQKDQVQ